MPEANWNSPQNSVAQDVVHIHTTTGSITEAVRVMVVAPDGTTVSTTYKRRDTGAAITPGATDIISVERQHLLIGAAVTVAVASGPTAVALPAPPAVTNVYGEIYPAAAYVTIQSDPLVGVGGIIYRLDGTAPTATIETELKLGSGMWLNNRAEITGFRANVAGTNGEILATAGQTVTLTVQYYNISPNVI